MDNETKLSKDQIEKMKNELKNSKDKTESVSGAVKRLLNEEQQREVKKIISNPQRLKDILSSPAFKKFMKENSKSED